MKYLMISLMTIGSIIAQDDFFEPGHTIGGYGELHWNQVMDNDNNKTKNTLDFHRFIIFFGYNYSEKWSPYRSWVTTYIFASLRNGVTV